MTADGFLPEGYAPPVKEARYVKLVKGETRLRILSKPMLGWVAWTSDKGKKKPVRRPENTFKEGEYDPAQEPKHFWAMPVWDYAAGKVKVWELTQVSIQKVLRGLSQNKKWGPPFDYDIVIQGTGDGMEREYSTVPEPKEPLDNAAADAWALTQANGFSLKRLLEGGDPFSKAGESHEYVPVEEDGESIPF